MMCIFNHRENYFQELKEYLSRNGRPEIGQPVRK